MFNFILIGMLILKILINYTKYFICFPTIFALAMQHLLIAATSLSNTFMVMFRHPQYVAKVRDHGLG